MNDLENYIMKVTAPLEEREINFENTKTVSFLENVQTIRVELINEEQEGWSPTMPEHSGRDQHMNFGLDLFAAQKVTAEFLGGSESYYYAIVRTGIRIEMPYGYHMMIGSRSGLGFKRHIQAFPGIIDHSYRGEIMVKLYAPLPFSIEAGDKIAQGLIIRSQNYRIVEGEVDQNTERGEKGFGSTGE